MSLRRLNLIAFSVVAGCLLSPANASLAAKGSSESEIRRVFNGYRKALLDKKGAAAANFVDANTLEYYRQMKRRALHASETQVRSQAMMDKLMVLRIRQEIPARRLLNMNPKQFFALGVDRGWIGTDSLRRLTIGKIEVQGKRATAQLVQSGSPVPFGFSFSKEAAGWKLDLTSMFPFVRTAFKSMVPKNQTEDEFIFDLLESLSGKKPNPALWKPLIPK